MKETRRRKALVLGVVAAMVVSLALPGDALAVSKTTGTGIRITDTGGSPLKQTTVTITFNDQTQTGKTDDDGALIILFDGNQRREDRPGAIVLIGDGRGTIRYDGGPPGGEAFTVKDGMMTIEPPGQPVDDDGGIGTREVAIGGGGIIAAIGLGVIAFNGDGDGSADNGNNTGVNNPGTPPPSSGPAGTYTLDWRILEDIRNSANFVRLQDARTGQISLNGSSATLTGQAPLPTLMGTWDSATQRLTASGVGPLAGRSNVGVRLEGTLSAAGVLNATVTVGEDGSLGPPLPHIVRYGLAGNLQPR